MKTAQRTTRTAVDRARRDREAWIFSFRRIRLVKGRGKRRSQPRIHKRVIPNLWGLAGGVDVTFRLAEDLVREEIFSG